MRALMTRKMSKFSISGGKEVNKETETETKFVVKSNSRFHIIKRNVLRSRHNKILIILKYRQR